MPVQFSHMHPTCLAASAVKQQLQSNPEPYTIEIFPHVSWPTLQLMALPEDKQLETLLDYMVAQASDAAGIEDLSPDQPLLELGLDSLRAAQFAVQVGLADHIAPLSLAQRFCAHMFRICASLP